MANVTLDDVYNNIINRTPEKLGFDFDVFPLTKMQYPLAAILFYIITIYRLSSNAKKRQLTGFQNFAIFAHNAVLCVFSVLCFTNTWPIIYNLWLQSWESTLCDDTFDNNDKWWYWTYLFYLSKYYEFIDTFILVWKGKNVSFLQKFHHVGAVMGMWIIVTSKSHTAYIFVIPNSFIHSLMYFYYALSVYKIRVPFKYILTRMQMIQFCIGLILGFIECYYWHCQKFPDKISIWWNAVYVPVLLILFLNFYIKAYIANKDKKNKQKSQ